MAFSTGGVFLAGRKKWQLKILPLIYLAIFYCFWKWSLGPEFAAITIPFILLYVSVFFAFLIKQKTIIVKYFGQLLFWIVFFLTLKNSITSIYARHNDPRTKVAKYILENVPQNTTLGFSAVSTEYSWTEHSWRYPQINLENYRLINFLEKPDLLIVSSRDIKEITPALESEKLKPGYIWDEQYKDEWYRYIPPSPEVFYFYDKLLNDKKSPYYLIKEFKYHPYLHRASDLYPEISIYQLKTSSLKIY